MPQYANKNGNNSGQRPQDRCVRELKIHTSPYRAPLCHSMQTKTATIVVREPQYGNKNGNNSGQRPQDRRVSELQIRTSPYRAPRLSKQSVFLILP